MARLCLKHGLIESTNCTTRNRCRKCVNEYRTNRRRSLGILEQKKASPPDVRCREIRAAVDKYQSTSKGRFNALRRNASARDIKVLLGLCHYCGGSLPKTGAGVDRLDSKLDYIVENAVPCCALCNFIKGKVSSDLFLQQIEKIYLFMKTPQK